MKFKITAYKPDWLAKTVCTISLYSLLCAPMLDYFLVYVICDVCDTPHAYAIFSTAIHPEPLSFMRRWKCQNTLAQIYF